MQNAVSEEVEISLTIPEMVKKALAASISSPRLSEIVHEDSKVALIVDDWARATPVSQILPTLLEELQVGGAKSENVDIVVALGTHRTMPQAALAERLGEAVVQQYRSPSSSTASTTLARRWWTWWLVIYRRPTWQALKGARRAMLSALLNCLWRELLISTAPSFTPWSVRLVAL